MEMSFGSIFLKGFKIANKQRRIAAIVYFIQLCLALTLGMQVHNVWESSIGNSLEINKLLKNYDHTVISDFLKVHGGSITPLIGQLRWLLLVWLIFAVFLDAGLLVCVIKSKKASAKLFWRSAAKYFFPFLKISLIFLFLALLWSALVFVPIAIYLQPSFEYFNSEKYSVVLVFLMMMIYFSGLAFLMAWSVVSRLYKIEKNCTIWQSIRQGWEKFWSNKSRFLGLLGCFLLFQLILIGLYWVIEAFVGMSSPALILSMFLLQQVFVFARVQLRQMMYASLTDGF
jgi:hypothetical protein